MWISTSRPTFKQTPLKKGLCLAGRVHFASLHAFILADTTSSDTSETTMEINLMPRGQFASRKLIFVVWSGAASARRVGKLFYNETC